MRQRGRKSAAALRLVHSDTGERAESPRTLTKEQKEIWDATLAAMPHDWFSAENLPLLEQYCVLISRARAINKKMNAESVGSSLYFRLLYVEQKFARNIAMLATKMRIAQQSTYDKSRRKGSQDLRPAWDADSEGEIPEDDEDSSH
jgi:hypothetical protein